jgi:hypothetical protein
MFAYALLYYWFGSLSRNSVQEGFCRLPLSEEFLDIAQKALLMLRLHQDIRILSSKFFHNNSGLDIGCFELAHRGCCKI